MRGKAFRLAPEDLDGVELRGIRGEEMQLELVLVVVHPSLDHPSVVVSHVI